MSVPNDSDEIPPRPMNVPVLVAAMFVTVAAIACVAGWVLA